MAKKSLKKFDKYRRGGEQLPLDLLDSDWQVPTELPDLRGRVKEIAWDVEGCDRGLAAGRGPGWPTRDGYLCGLGAAWEGGSIYLPIRHPDTACLDKDAVARWYWDHAKDPALRNLFHNAGYDVGWIGTSLAQPPPAGPIEDTGGMAYMVDENRLNYTLDVLCKWQGVPGKDETLLRQAADMYKVDPKVELYKLPARFVGAYGAGDPASTLALAGKLRPLMAEQGVENAYRLEMDLIPLIVAMQRRGVLINRAAAETARQALLGKRDKALAEMAVKLELGYQLGMEEMRGAKLAALFDRAKIAYPRTEAGAPSFKKEWMRLESAPWLARLVDRARRMDDAANKFIKGFLLDFSHGAGNLARIHASVNQFRGSSADADEDDGTEGTRSHRFSYSNPPLQQMPARDEELTAVIRGAFEPEPGEMWLAADYSQQEYRLIVHFASAMGLRGADAAVARYREDPTTDFHSYVAEITGLERKPAKDSNFAKAYGAQVPKFASMIGKSLDEAQAIYDQYDRELPFVSLLMRDCERLANKRGYIVMMDGARSHFDMWEGTVRRPDTGQRMRCPPTTRERAQQWADNMSSELGVRARVWRADVRKAGNRLIQGGAARQMKMAMRECWRAGIVPLLQMHDELDLSVDSPRVGEQVREIMRGIEARRLRVPFLVDLEYGPTWGWARKVKSLGYKASWDEAVQLRERLAVDTTLGEQAA